MSCMYGFLGLFLDIFQAIRLYLFAFLIFLCTPFSYASHFLDDITVYEKDGVYYINVSSDISASEKHVRDVITDYDHIYRLSDSIVESKILRTTDDRVQVETLVQCCMPMFCRDVTRVEIVSELEYGLIRTKIVPEKSDFLSGEATWNIEPTGLSTRLSYIASLEPDFFIPPVLGTQMVIENIRDEFSTTFKRIEHIARVNEAKEWDDDFEFIRAEFTSAVDRQTDEPCNTALLSSF